MKKTITILAIISAIIILLDSCLNHEKNEKAALTSITFNDQMVMSNPDKFAWDLFIKINQPASENPKLAFWETWMLASCVFDNPDQAPAWNGEKEKDIETLETMPIQQLLHLNINPKTMFDPNSPTRNETRMNRAVFDFIVNNNLYNAEGLESFYSSFPEKKINFPIEAQEVKAIWEIINVKDTARYHYAVGRNGRTYFGLKGLHIITKDIPNWFWSTFEHIDNFKESREFQANKELLASKDSYGYNTSDNMSENLKNDFILNKMADKWKYYRLRGTQTDFIDPMGKPIVLANTKIEDGFMITSSCMTCHAKATVGAKTPDLRPTGPKNYNRLPVFKGSSIQAGDIGLINPGLFYSEYSGLKPDTLIKTTKPKYIQTDFMWSFFRVKRKGNPDRTCQ